MKYRRIFLSPPHMGGEEMLLVREAFESNYIAPIGPMVDAFEREFAKKVGIQYAVALTSGTAAMHLALRLLGVDPGEEVFASTFTFIGSVTPVTFLGGVPVFIDSDRTSWNMDTELLEQELEVCAKRGKLPKAVVPTDLYGQCCWLPRILKICNEFGIPVVCDSAEAMGAKYDARSEQRAESSEQRAKYEIRKTDLRPPPSDLWRHAGAGARAAVFSFNGNKIITTSGGGMLASEDKEFIEQARFLSQQARDPFSHYEHSQIGYNYRMSNILAAIGRGQLRVLDERVKRKREIFDYYQNALGDVPGIEFIPETPYGRCNRWLTVILVTPEDFGADREEVRLALEAENIEARPVWKPMHMQPVFNPQITQIDADYKKKEKRYKARVVGGEVAEDLFNRGLCLPSGTAMTKEDMDRVISTILKCRKQ